MKSLKQNCWDIRFMRMAHEVASWSKDPSTKVGCVLVKDRKIISMGYNGFPRLIEDDLNRLIDREVKYEMTVHAEQNAVITAALHGISTAGSITTSLSVHAVAVLLYLLTLVFQPSLYQPQTSHPLAAGSKIFNLPPSYLMKLGSVTKSLTPNSNEPY